MIGEKCFRVILGLEINPKFASFQTPLQPVLLLHTAESRERTGEGRGTHTVKMQGVLRHKHELSGREILIH